MLLCLTLSCACSDLGKGNEVQWNPLNLKLIQAQKKKDSNLHAGHSLCTPIVLVVPEPLCSKKVPLCYGIYLWQSPCSQQCASGRLVASVKFSPADIEEFTIKTSNWGCCFKCPVNFFNTYFVIVIHLWSLFLDLPYFICQRQFFFDLPFDPSVTMFRGSSVFWSGLGTQKFLHLHIHLLDDSVLHAQIHLLNLNTHKKRCFKAKSILWSFCFDIFYLMKSTSLGWSVAF